MIKFQKVDHVFQAKNWIISSWKLFKRKPLTWVFMVLIFLVFIVIGSSYFIGKFIIALLLPVLAGGIFIAFDKASREEPIELENLLSVFKDKPILKELLTVGVIGVAAISLTILLQYLTGTEYTVKQVTSSVEGSSDLFTQVSEGSFFTSIVSWVWSGALLFGIPLIAINREPAIPALKHSLLGSLFNIVPLFAFFGMIILLTIISILPVGLGLFILFPIVFGATYFAFKEIYVEAETHYISELAENLGAVAQEIAKEEEKSVVYTNNKAHQEADLKESYRSIRIFNMLGMALIALGTIIAAYTYYSLQIGTNTIGNVVSVKTHQNGTSSSRSTSYTPTFSFRDKYGKQHTAPTSYGSSELNYPVGARVNISYNPDNYSTVQINSIKSIFYFPMFIWLFGGALIWFTRSAKKNVDKNGVPPRKSVFLKEGSNSRDIVAELNNSEVNNVSDMLEVVFKDKQDSEVTNNTVNDNTVNDNTNKDAEKNELIELVLPKKFTFDLYDEYMHITVSWFGKKTAVFTLAAVMQIGFSLILFSTDLGNSTGTSSSLLSSLIPWIVALSAAVFLYYAIATWLNKTHIYVSQNAIEIKHKPIPWFGNKRLVTKDIKQLYSRKNISRSTSNNRSSISYALHVISFNEDDMTLLKVENSQQAQFLEQQIEIYLGIKNLKVRGEIG